MISLLFFLFKPSLKLQGDPAPGKDMFKLFSTVNQMQCAISSDKKQNDTILCYTLDLLPCIVDVFYYTNIHVTHCGIETSSKNYWKCSL